MISRRSLGIPGGGEHGVEFELMMSLRREKHHRDGRWREGH